MDTTQKKKQNPPKRTPRRKPEDAVATKKSPVKTKKQPAPAKKVTAKARPEKLSRPRPQRRRQAETAQPKPTPDVVYTPAKPFNRNRLLLRLTTVVAVVLALTFGISIFFKVEKVTVSGNLKYSAWTVKEASGIQIGDNLLTFGKAKASGKITAALPYVESVRIGIKLPDTVNIEIKELDVAYSVQDSADNWWLVTSEGRVIEQVDSAVAADNLKIIGVNLWEPASGQQAVAYEPVTDATEDTSETAPVTTPVTVTSKDRLTAALTILQYLEKEELFDNVISVDVTSLGNIELWYGQQFRVILGDTSQLAYKIRLMNGAINGPNGLKDYDSGILDITFMTSQGEVVIYEPFD